MLEPMVLVGIGRHDLPDLMKKIGTPEEYMLVEGLSRLGWPPRYRRLSICTQEEVEVFQQYLRWVLNSMIPEKEE